MFVRGISAILFLIPAGLIAGSSNYTLSVDGLTVYDAGNGITWLANGNLAASNRFGLPLCNGTGNGQQTCIDAGGAMNYGAAAAWVAAMNAANYLGHSNWQLPTTPAADKNCGKTGPAGNSFGFGCTAGALDTIYNSLGLKSPASAVPIAPGSTGPFRNLQPYLYWSQSSAGSQNGNSTFSFATGWTGANTLPNFLYLWPMIPGKLPGAGASSGSGLQVSADGQTVYDPMTNVTWLANANLAASNSFGLPACTGPTNPAVCVAEDGAMTWASAQQFIANMNSAAYLGQTNWQAPAIAATCPGYKCDGSDNPMGNLFYDQLGAIAGTSAVSMPNTAAGPFASLQPYLYWTCGGATIQSACDAAGAAANQEWSYSFGSGFQGTDLLANNLYVTAYFVGDRAVTAPPVISLVANAEGESPVIAPNTWVEIKGSGLAPAGDIRIWQTADFAGGKLPAALDGVSVTVNGKAAYLYYISPTQVNILTPPDAMTGAVQVVVTVGNAQSAPYSAQAQAASPSFFVINGGPYVVAQHSADYSLIGPASLYVGTTTPAKPGETVVLYANGFGPTTTAVVSGSETQSGNLSPMPAVTIGGMAANVTYAALISPGLYQFNVVVPQSAASGDNQLAASINGVATSPTTLITVESAAPATTANFYVSTKGSDSWSGLLAAPNAAGTDGPFGTFDRARAAVAALNKSGLTQVTVQFRGGVYYLPATVQFTAADSGTAAAPIVYTNYTNETPVFSGGMRLSGWTNTSGNTWKLSLAGSPQYFENLWYNGSRRLRPRLGSGNLGSFLRSAATVYLAASAPNCTVNITGSGWECFDRFQYDPSDPISTAWKNYAPAPNNPCNQPAGNPALAGDIEVLDFEQFSTSKLRISCIDSANHVVYLTGPTPISQSNPSQVGFIAGNRYMVDNVEDQLTLPGQWFLDRSATPMTLTYLANPGENPNNDTVIAPQLAQLVMAYGLQYVTFHGLTFEHDNYVVPAAGHKSSELEADIPGAVSFQNSQHVTFDSGVVTQIAGTGLEFISCVSAGSPNYCVATNGNAITANDTVENSAFYDIGVLPVRIGDPYVPAFTDANEPQFMTVENNVAEGYGRTIPASFGIGQGEGHDNLYTHNDVYDGYHCAISISEQAPDTTKPAGEGNANNTISFNHVWNLLQGIMNDGGSIRIEAGNNAYTAPGNKILNNRIHDVTDASIQDSNGYGGDGIYLDNQTGLVDVENNLVYRVSSNAVFTPQGPASPNEANIVKNNILAYAQKGLVAVNFPYPYGVPPAVNQVFQVSNNLLYFDRSTASSPKFYAQDGCTYSAGFPYAQFWEWNSNLYWRTDGGFATDPKTFYVQPNPVTTGGIPPCSNSAAQWTFYTFASWQTTFSEDAGSVISNPGFNNPAYPTDDYTLPKGSPGVGFVVFDYTQAGRSNPVLKPAAIAPTFPTMYFNPATDY